MPPMSGMPPPAMAVAASVFLRRFSDRGFRRDQQGGHRSGVLQSDANHFGRVDDAHLDQVAVLFGLRVEAEVLRAFFRADAADDDRAFNARVFGDLADRGFERLADDVDASLLVFVVAYRT